METWKAIDITGAKYLGILELTATENDFEVVRTIDDKLVFGTACNVGLLQSGYMQMEEDETIDQALSELLEELETYYQDGAKYCSRAVFNERM